MDRDELFRRMAVLSDEASRHLRAAKEAMEGAESAIGPPEGGSLADPGASEVLKRRLEQANEARRRAIHLQGAALDALLEANRLGRDYMRDRPRD